MQRIMVQEGGTGTKYYLLFRTDGRLVLRRVGCGKEVLVTRAGSSTRTMLSDLNSTGPKFTIVRQLNPPKGK